MHKFDNPTGGSTRCFDCHKDPMFDDRLRTHRVLVNGQEIKYVYRIRLGSKGYADAYSNPVAVNRSHDAAKRRPRLRGVVELVP